MRSFKITLCSYKTEALRISVRATMCNGCLTIEGHDLGERVREFWLDDEYEYSYTFDQANTKRLLEMINGKSNHKIAWR